MKMPLMFLVMMLLFAGANVYVFWRLWHMMPPIPAARWIMLSLGLIATACCFLYFLISNSAPGWLVSTVYKVGMSWIIIFLYILIGLLVMDLVRITRLLPMEWMMQGSWKGFAAFAGAIIIVMTAGNIIYHNKRKVHIKVPAEISFHGRPLRIVAVSDLHLGYGIGSKEFAGWVDIINAESPDAVLIAGDAIDTSLRPLYDQNMAEIFGRINAPMGVYAVPGNHEYISGIGKSKEFFSDTGVVLLQDSAVLVDDLFYVLGRDDATNRDRQPLSELVSGLDRSKPIILLDHQPYGLEESADNGITLQLSGHTHYGQVWPISWITKALFEKPHGSLKKGDTWYYISSGLGIWGGKFRIGTRSEYVVIEFGN